jgi:CRISPR-associated protein (TIGR03986 family)
MPFIPSPYNFVPLEEQVFFPGWEKEVSMDVPFSDGISGFLDIKVTAKTPLYIRNGGEHPEDQRTRLNNQEYKDFYRVVPGGPYAIPGTSLKGMLRGVIEIISHGKIAGSTGKTSRVVNNRYAIRDLQNRDLYTGHITEDLGRRTYRSKARSAWLRRAADGGWELLFCDMARVEQEDLERAFCGGRNLLAGRQSAQRKYNAIPALKNVDFDAGPEIDHPHTRGNHLRYRKATNIGKGKTKGILVMTGQPAPRDGRPGKKHMEFIFFNPSSSAVPVPGGVKKDFEFAHSDLGENRKENEEWGFWKKKLKDGKNVPVFVLEDRGKISSMGLAMMFRLPYKHSILDTVEHTSPDHLDGSRLDLGELLFGRVEDTDGLRGRIVVETMPADGKPKPLPEVATVLGSPKPTYYPNYIKQSSSEDGSLRGEYKTYMNDDAEIRGWKRYVTQPDGYTPRPEAAPTQNVETRFRPLPEGTVFRGRIYVHNLRPKELGALAWAITWGGDSNLRHSLGMGKPLGYGSVSLAVTGGDLFWCDPSRSESLELGECQKAFVEMMDKALGKPWEKSDTLRALKAMAHPGTSWRQDLRYPVLGRGRDGNEFVVFKRDRNVLLDPVQGMSGRGPSTPPTNRSNPPNHPTSPGRTNPPGQGGRNRNSSPGNTAPPVVRREEPARELSPAEKFYNEMDTMRNNDLLRRLKSEELNPEKVEPELRKKIAKKLERNKADARFREHIARWRG